MKQTREQQEVVEHPSEPVRVEAGAGTGKTTTLAMRVVSLIRSQELAPSEILGITFTNKAAQELADRIRVLLPGASVEVHTYHGFAAELVREFGALSGIERDFRVITPTFSRQLLLESIVDGSFEHLDLTYLRGVVADLIKLGADLGDNLMGPADLAGAAPPDLPDPWPRRLELASALETFDRVKRKLGVLDYGDLVSAAFRLVEHHPEVAERIRERYRSVLLDEYQDTNPAQRELLRRIFPPGFGITAVGDPNQTIYEWRGASRENFADFPIHFPREDGSPAPTLPLTLNRRSDRRLLAVANAIARKLGSVNDLRPRPGAGEGTVAVRWARTALDEADALAEEIERLHHDEGLAWRDIAILFRKNKDMPLIRDALASHEIPFEVANLGGLLSIPEVIELHAWLRIVDDPTDTAALGRILRGSRFRLGLADLTPLAEWIREKNGAAPDPEWAVPRHSLIEAIEQREQLSLRGEARRALGEFLDLYRKVLADAQGVSLVELARRVLDAISAWEEIEAMPDPARLSARLNLYRFLDLTEEWSPLEGRPSLRSFLDYLRLTQEEEGEDLDSARLSNEDAVALLTVHRAKGLEWEAVFLPALYSGNFPSRARLFEDPLRFGHILPYELRIDRRSLPRLIPEMDLEFRKDLLRQRHEDQEWRTAYVAVTRAKSLLYATGAFWVGGPVPLSRPAVPSALFDLIRDTPGTRDLGSEASPGARPDLLRLEPIGGAPDPIFPEGWEAALRACVEDGGWARRLATELGVSDRYEHEVTQLTLTIDRMAEQPPQPTPSLSTSVSALVTYTICPRRYFWSHVDRLPRRSGRAARRGLQIHRRIELHNRGTVPFDDLDADLYDTTAFEGAHEGRSDPFQVFLGSRFGAVRPRWVEVPFELALARDVRVRGRVDAVYAHEGGAVEVVDFKTGAAGHPAAGVQLEAYALAVTEAGLAEPPLTATFAYLSGELREESTVADARWLAGARKHLTSLTDGISAQDFEPSPSEACASCDFIRFCSAGRAWLEADAGIAKGSSLGQSIQGLPRQGRSRAGR